MISYRDRLSLSHLFTLCFQVRDGSIVVSSHVSFCALIILFYSPCICVACLIMIPIVLLRLSYPHHVQIFISDVLIIPLQFVLLVKAESSLLCKIFVRWRNHHCSIYWPIYTTSTSWPSTSTDLPSDTVVNRRVLRTWSVWPGFTTSTTVSAGKVPLTSS